MVIIRTNVRRLSGQSSVPRWRGGVDPLDLRLAGLCRRESRRGSLFAPEPLNPVSGDRGQPWRGRRAGSPGCGRPFGASRLPAASPVPDLEGTSTNDRSHGALRKTRPVDGSFDVHRDRRDLFGTDAAAYEAGRPGYPERVYGLLRDRCGLGARSRVVEVGPGTGQATQRLLDAGASVTAVELSADLASRLAAKCGAGKLKVKIGAFEDTEFAPGSVDLVASATAFHWVPLESGLRQCADMLRGGGSLALWWNVYGDPNRPDPFRQALTPILGRLAPSVLEVPGAGNPGTAALPYALDVEARVAEIDSAGRFDPVHHEVIAWTGRHRPDELRALFASFSPWLSLPAPQRAVALDAVERLAVEDFGGIVERPYLTPIYLAHKPT